MGMKAKVALGAVVGLVVIGVVSANTGGNADNGDGGTGHGSSTAADRHPGGSGKKADSAGEDTQKAPKASQAEQFKAFVGKNGTPKEKEAVGHVLKVQGADRQNDILDSADIHTDFTGGLTGNGAGPVKLIASAFAEWKDSENGLVTVYDADGEIITNGNF